MATKTQKTTSTASIQTRTFKEEKRVTSNRTVKVYFPEKDNPSFAVRFNPDRHQFEVTHSFDAVIPRWEIATSSMFTLPWTAKEYEKHFKNLLTLIRSAK